VTKISAVILTKNEESNIVDCLESIGFVDEIIVIDDESIDRTVELSEMLGAKVILRKLKNFSDQRNFGLQKVTNDWVLSIDADEKISDSLKKEILEVVRRNEADGYYIKRDDYMWGKKLKHGEAKSIKIIRLAKRGNGKWSGKVHERWKINGQIGVLKNPIVHIPHPTIAEFIKEIDHYTTLRAEELGEDGVKSRLFAIILYPAGKFLLNYIAKQGYKDGIAGFVYAAMMSLHSFLVRSKLFLLQNR